MVLLFLESAFSVCLGCKIFNLIKKEKATNCPGGACEIRIKDPIQKFTFMQKVIVILTVIAMSYGAYAYMTKLDEQKYQKELEAFENDDDF